MTRQCQHLLSDGGFVLVAKDCFWTDMFVQYFLEAPQDVNKDDMLFYVRKTSSKSKLNIPQVSVLMSCVLSIEVSFTKCFLILGELTKQREGLYSVCLIK